MAANRRGNDFNGAAEYLKIKFKAQNGKPKQKMGKTAYCHSERSACRAARIAEKNQVCFQ
jgi:hypothetical protein